MYGINYQLTVYMLVMLICLRTRSIDKYLGKAGYT